jgi:hypothetical protein
MKKITTQFNDISTKPQKNYKILKKNATQINFAFEGYTGPREIDVFIPKYIQQTATSTFYDVHGAVNLYSVMSLNSNNVSTTTLFENIIGQGNTFRLYNNNSILISTPTTARNFNLPESYFAFSFIRREATSSITFWNLNFGGTFSPNNIISVSGATLYEVENISFQIVISPSTTRDIYILEDFYKFNF